MGEAMTIRVGLMGFGRIGRNLFRILLDREDIEIAVISDIANHDGLEYLLRYDTILGRFPYELSIKDGSLYTLGTQIKMLSARDPGDEPPRPLAGARVPIRGDAARAERDGHHLRHRDHHQARRVGRRLLPIRDGIRIRV